MDLKFTRKPLECLHFRKNANFEAEYVDSFAKK